MLVCCVFGYLETYQHWDVIKIFPQVTYRFSDLGLMDDGRTHSVFPHAILFGCALTLVTPIALYLLTLAKSRAQRIYLWSVLLLMFWNNYKTMSRGPWLALILSAALMILFAEATIRKLLLIIAILAVVVLVIRPGVWDTLKNTYSGTFDPDDPRGESYQYRYDLMRVSRAALAKNLSRSVWGFGPESFYYVHLEGENPATGHTVPFETCDSAVVEIMVDTGYVGLFITALLLIKPAFTSLREFLALPKPAHGLSLILFINIVAFCFMMLSVMNYGWGQQSHMLWILVALSMGYGDIVRREALVEQTAHSSQSQDWAWQFAEPSACGYGRGLMTKYPAGVGLRSVGFDVR